MVFISKVLYAISKRSKRGKAPQVGTFLDKLELVVRGGAGGPGLPKFGGIGGNGGSVIIEAEEGATLKSIRQKYSDYDKISASVGNPSKKASILGKKGDDHVIPVPKGISAYDRQGNIIGEVNEEGEKLVIARGGMGGCPQTGYFGMKGQIHKVRLELKLIADIGFVGFPNAGKSTLLRALSNARPKIASYPFTTMMPNIGIITYKDHRQISLADLPGLIEGAHVNIGLGHRFLRHVERTKALLLVVDINGFRLSAEHLYRSCLETVILLNKELELYKEELLDKPAILVVNKMDSPDAATKFNEISDDLKNLSSLNGK
ncbi:unnamed protein product [Bemisia tabaci]|uniref:GTP-binding protein 10 n=1 Tax=Bemisia tabaci TaxID=7038 RepID=A0A9P0F5Z8_BEMTA|nr:unnamed protein product [Bemisia tabaci]